MVSQGSPKRQIPSDERILPSEEECPGVAEKSRTLLFLILRFSIVLKAIHSAFSVVGIEIDMGHK